MGRRTLLLLASILVAAAGTAMIWVYVRNADARAQATWGDRVWVLRATKAISVGDGYAQVQAAAQRVPVPRQLVPADPVTSIQQLTGKAAVMPVAAGSLLLAGQFDAARTPPGVAARTVGITIPLDDPARMAGLLHPGSLVTVYLVEQQAQQGKGTTRRQRAFVLIRHIRVLGLGNTTTARNGRGQPAQIGTQRGVSGGDVMLEADADQAKKLVLAVNSGNILWLGVLNSEKDAPPAGDAITLDQLLDPSNSR
jgi:pilus assembly protein CpaB